MGSSEPLELSDLFPKEDPLANVTAEDAGPEIAAALGLPLSPPPVQPVAVEWTSCAFGGSRAWFRCPACGRRAAILYGADVFACRDCLHLAYKSQQEAPHDRALRRAQKLHERLGGTGILVDPISKPKGMHWRTYFLKVERMYKAEICAVPPWLLRFEAKQ